jgi:hypothetical protein
VECFFMAQIISVHKCTLICHTFAIMWCSNPAPSEHNNDSSLRSQRPSGLRQFKRKSLYLEGYLFMYFCTLTPYYDMVCMVHILRLCCVKPCFNMAVWKVWVTVFA